MSILRSWWKWFKNSWRIIVLQLIIGITIGFPVKIFELILLNIKKENPSLAIVMCVVLLLILLPVYTFIFTKLISVLWKPSDIYSKLQLTANQNKNEF
ncbi:MAG: hypothetical protein DRI44_03820 [Chlamydiae bacterium]|nr:MAG: hypothetical protein DRI44_03820 [Chlamydiota bacterium]